MRFRELVLTLAVVPACSLVDALINEDKTTAAGIGYTTDNIPAGGVQAKSVAIGELNGNAGLDAAVIDDTGGLVLCFQRPTASSSIEFDVMPGALGGAYTLVAIANLDGDAFSEVIAAGPGKVDVWRHAGAGTFQLHTALPIAADAIPTRIAAGNLPLGPGDSIAVVSDKMQVDVYASVLGGAPVHDPLILMMSTGPSGRALAIGDTNGGASGAELLVSDGMNLVEYSGPSPMMRKETATPSTEPRVFAVGDYGSSEHLDLAYYAPMGVDSRLVVSHGSPTGLFEMGMPIGTVGGNELLAGDFDGNDDTMRPDDDLAFLDTGGPVRRIAILTSNGTESFDRLDLMLEGAPNAFATGDLDEDGKSDFALVPGAMGGVDLLLSRR